MGFFSKLKKVVNGVDEGAAIASTLPGPPGAAAGSVSQTLGVVTAVVQQIHSKPESELPPAEAQKQATLATAVAVDDHEQRVQELEKMVAQLQAQLAAQGGPAPAQPQGQPPAS